MYHAEAMLYPRIPDAVLCCGSPRRTHAGARVCMYVCVCVRVSIVRCYKWDQKYKKTHMSIVDVDNVVNVASSWFLLWQNAARQAPTRSGGVPVYQDEAIGGGIKQLAFTTGKKRGKNYRPVKG